MMVGNRTMASVVIAGSCAALAFSGETARADHYSVSYSSCGSATAAVMYDRAYYRPAPVVRYVVRPTYVVRRPVTARAVYYRPVVRPRPVWIRPVVTVRRPIAHVTSFRTGRGWRHPRYAGGVTIRVHR